MTTEKTDLLSKFEEKEIALAMHNNNDFDSLSLGDCEGLLEESRKQIKDGGYTIYGDDEADDEWGNVLNNYIGEQIYPEIIKTSPTLYNYFDEVAWKYDARRNGRGYYLSKYNGNEYEQTVNGTTYYIYRQR